MMIDRYDNDESLPIARCEECGEIIFDDNKEVYVNDDGEYFCGLECVLGFYGVHLSEDCMVFNDD